MAKRPRRREPKRAGTHGDFGYRGRAAHRAAGDAEWNSVVLADGSLQGVKRLVTARMVDALHANGQLTYAQHWTATDLRDLWEQAGLAQQRLGSHEWQAGRVPGWEYRSVADDRAFARYVAVARQVPRHLWACLRAVVIEDRDPRAYGRGIGRDGLSVLRHALDVLGGVGF